MTWMDSSNIFKAKTWPEVLAEKFGDDPDEDRFLNSPKTKVLFISSDVNDDEKAF